MKTTEHYAHLLGVNAPWSVKDVMIDKTAVAVNIHIEYDGNAAVCCPTCGQQSPRYDKVSRKWRHADTMQYHIWIFSKVPRVQCKEHGVLQIRVPWAEPGSGYTAMFEAFVIDWLLETSVSAVARNFGLGWDAVDNIRQRAVERGIARREGSAPTNLCVDETAYKRGHKYVTVISDQATGTVMDVVEDRTKESLLEFLESLTTEELSAIESISMDMSMSYISAVRSIVPEADTKICFDRFHISQHLSKAVDKVRRQEHAALMKIGDTSLKWTKYDWLREPASMKRDAWLAFKELLTTSYQTARAWMYKEHAKHLWNYQSRTWAIKQWKSWINRVIRTNIEPLKKAGRTVRDHLWGILNAILLGKTNALAESINARIRKINNQAHGFKSAARFRVAILFKCGGLDLYPSQCHF